MSCCMISEFSTLKKIYEIQMSIASIHRVPQP